jgi:hypothetical protein
MSLNLSLPPPLAAAEIRTACLQHRQHFSGTFLDNQGQRLLLPIASMPLLFVNYGLQYRVGASVEWLALQQGRQELHNRVKGDYILHPSTMYFECEPLYYFSMGHESFQLILLIC